MPDPILVTGGAGFIGANLIRHLLESGAQPRVLDDFSTGRWEHLSAVEHQIEVEEGDVRDLRTLRRAAEGVGAILHLAAVAPGGPRDDEARTLDVNVKGTLDALMVARELRIPLVFASSAAVYGARDACLLHEQMPPEPRTALGVYKLAGENLCRLFHERHGVQTVVLRIFHTFGPFEDGSSPHAGVVARFAHSLAAGKKSVVFGDGLQTRDLVYVSNVCEAFVQALRSRDAKGGFFNVGSGEGIAINLLYQQLCELGGVPCAPARGPARPGDTRHVRAALGHAAKGLCYAPRVRLREGLERTMAWHRERAVAERDRAWFSGQPPAASAAAEKSAPAPAPALAPAPARPPRPAPAAASAQEPDEIEADDIPMLELEELGA